MTSLPVTELTARAREIFRRVVEEYIESVLSKRRIDHDIVSKESEQTEEKEINPIVLKQLKSLKSSLESNKLTVNDILKHLKDNE